MDVPSLWHELRRRRVVRLAVIYGLVGWGVIQAADTIFPALEIPTWAISLAVALVLLGFPVALVLAWSCDGMTEEILNALAKVRHLHVASRTSSFAFKGQDSDVLEIARRLRVGTVVEGSVRKAGNRIRRSLPPAGGPDRAQGRVTAMPTPDRSLA